MYSLTTYMSLHVNTDTKEMENAGDENPFILPDLPDLPTENLSLFPTKTYSNSSALNSSETTTGNPNLIPAENLRAAPTRKPHMPPASEAGIAPSENSKLAPADTDNVTADVNLLDTSLVISESEASVSSKESTTSRESSNANENKFSCKNYRIVCHCGAANCRKFLF